MKRRKFNEWYDDFLKYNQNGSVPYNFVTPEGKKLGCWVHNVRGGDIRLTLEQKQLLEDANFIWALKKEKRKFEKWYMDFFKYSKDGSLPAKFITPEGYKLGRWIRNVRSGSIKLTVAQKQMLNNTNFVWSMQREFRKFEEWYKDFLKYNQNGSVPVKFITPEGNKLGNWVNNIRAGRIKLVDEQRQLLNDANFIWSLKKGRKHSCN